MQLKVKAEAEPRPVVPEMLLRVLWADELRQCCVEIGAPATSRATRSVMVKHLLSHLDGADLIGAACRRLRARDALWRADDPVGNEEALPLEEPKA